MKISSAQSIFINLSMNYGYNRLSLSLDLKKKEIHRAVIPSINKNVRTKINTVLILVDIC